MKKLTLAAVTLGFVGMFFSAETVVAEDRSDNKTWEIGVSRVLLEREWQARSGNFSDFVSEHKGSEVRLGFSSSEKFGVEAAFGFADAYTEGVFEILCGGFHNNFEGGNEMFGSLGAKIQFWRQERFSLRGF